MKQLPKIYDVELMGKYCSLIKPQRDIVSDEMLGQVYECFRTENLQLVESRRKQNQATRNVTNDIAIPIHGRIVEMRLIFRVVEDGLKLNPSKESIVGFIRKRLDSIFN